MNCFSDMFVYYIKDVLEDFRATTDQTNGPVIADVGFVPLFENGSILRHFPTIRGEYLSWYGFGMLTPEICPGIHDTIWECCSQYCRDHLISLG